MLDTGITSGFNPASGGQRNSALTAKSRQKEDYQAFLDGEVRYNALREQIREKAKNLFNRRIREAMERYDYLKKLVELYKAEE